ncbi:hypothetical protein Tsubulata_041450, partial [Turnera subulata]
GSTIVCIPCCTFTKKEACTLSSHHNQHRVIANITIYTLMEFMLPGFRFHPTEDELLDFYLKETILSRKICFDVIGFLNIYCYEPWDLPGLAKIGEREWYFFVPRESKNGTRGRPNRTTETGYWKATGTDRPIRCSKDPRRLLGHRKTLVFYQGKAGRGCKTDWVMNEYRLPGTSSLANKFFICSIRESNLLMGNYYVKQEDIVLCKVYRKATSLKLLEQRAEVARMCQVAAEDTISSNERLPLQEIGDQEEQKVGAQEELLDSIFGSSGLGGVVGSTKEKLSELQVPKFSMEWTMDSLWALLMSPMIEIPTDF